MITIEKSNEISKSLEEFYKAILPSESYQRRKNMQIMATEEDSFHRNVSKPFLDYMRLKIVQDIRRAVIKAKTTPTIFTEFVDWEDISTKGKQLSKPAYVKVLDKSGTQAAVVARVEAGFDVMNVNSIKWAEKYSAEMVTQVTKETKKALREVITDGMKHKYNKLKIARQINKMPIGLNLKQTQALHNFRDKLIAEGFSSKLVEKRVKSYYNRLLRQRSRSIARTETSRAVNEGYLQGLEQQNVYRRVKISMAADACHLCTEHEGRIFTLEEAHAFLPIHPHCYDKETEIYTKSGWKYFKDVKMGESILTLIPESKQLEWNKVINKIKYKQDKMISLTNRQNSFDMLVSKNHPYFGYKRIMKNAKRTVEPVWYDNIKKLNSEFAFYNSSKWQGEEREKTNINGIVFNTKDYCRLLAYFLSEGSIVRRNNTRWQISIAQSNHLEKMWKDIKDLPLNRIWLGKDKIYISDDRLGEYLSQFGKSYEKYIPDEIKNLSAKYIRIFLDAYLLGDGNIKKGKNWKDGNFKDSRVYFTSSKRMSDDLGELIIKIGKSVSYKEDKCKGNKVKFKNGTYIINNDLWRVNELTSNYKFYSNLIIKEVNYNNMVYDVEVKNHTILTRRNGKVIWGSNCRCAWVVVWSKRPSFMPPVWKPTMTQAEADEWAKGSQFADDVFYHGTSVESATGIKVNGFDIKKLAEYTQNGGINGAGHYMTLTKQQAELYLHGKGELLNLKLNVKKVLVKTSEKINLGIISDDAWYEARKLGNITLKQARKLCAPDSLASLNKISIKDWEVYKKIAQANEKWGVELAKTYTYQSAGYDAIYSANLNEICVFGKENIVVMK